jgi:hypothetical protein
MDADMTQQRYDELVNDGFIEISEGDWNYYIGNMGGGANGTGYIRGADGKPTDAPAYVPTTDEKIAALDADYNQQKQDLINEYTDAQIHADDEAIALVQEEMTELDEWYDEEYRKIEEENETEGE